MHMLLLQAWLELGNEDPEARHQIEVAQTAGRDPVSAKLSLRLLKKLLQHRQVAPLLQVATRFGRRDK
jgi:ferritin-like protein